MHEAQVRSFSIFYSGRSRVWELRGDVSVIAPLGGFLDREQELWNEGLAWGQEPAPPAGVAKKSRCGEVASDRGGGQAPATARPLCSLRAPGWPLSSPSTMTCYGRRLQWRGFRKLLPTSPCREPQLRGHAAGAAASSPGRLRSRAAGRTAARELAHSLSPGFCV